MKFLHDDDFIRWTIKCGIDEISNTPQSHQTVIWVNGLLSDTSVLENARGLRLSGKLGQHCMNELAIYNLTWNEYMKKGSTRIPDPRKNHFTYINQLILANYFNDLIIKHRDNTLTVNDLNLDMIPWETNKEVLYSQLFKNTN